jgi:hypothetical protein
VFVIGNPTVLGLPAAVGGAQARLRDAGFALAARRALCDTAFIPPALKKK